MNCEKVIKIVTEKIKKGKSKRIGQRGIYGQTSRLVKFRAYNAKISTIIP